MDELEVLLKELTGRSGKVRTGQPDPDMEAAIAWSKIRSVYGPFGADVTLEKFRRQKSVTQMLGRTKHISLRSVILAPVSYLLPAFFFAMSYFLNVSFRARYVHLYKFLRNHI